MKLFMRVISNWDFKGDCFLSTQRVSNLSIVLRYLQNGKIIKVKIIKFKIKTYSTITTVKLYPLKYTKDYCLYWPIMFICSECVTRIRGVFHVEHRRNISVNNGQIPLDLIHFTYVRPLLHNTWRKCQVVYL